MKPKRNNGFLNALLFLTLIASLLVAGFGTPGFLLGLLKPKEPVINRGKEWEQIPSSQRNTGHSNPFEISPREGVTIRAEKDALDKDRTFTMSECTKAELDQLSASYTETGFDLAAVGAAWHLDAGLEDDEMFPGVYEMEFDLSAIGIAPENYDCVSPYRINDKGEWTALVYRQENGILTTWSNQNSFVAVMVSAIKIAITVDALDALALRPGIIAFESMFKSLNEFPVYSIKDPESQIFNLQIPFDDPTKELKKSRDQIFNSTLEGYKMMLRQQAGITGTDVNVTPQRQLKETMIAQEALKLTRDQLSKEPIYTDLVQQIQEKITEIINPERTAILMQDLRLAYDYYQNLEMEMPCWVTQVILSSSLPRTVYASTKGNAIPGPQANPWIYVNDSYDLKTADEKDEMLSTIAHEYYHVLQRMKRNTHLSNHKYDEATAQVAEFYAYQQFFKDGHVSKSRTIDNFENARLFHMFAMPMDILWGNVDYGDLSYSFSKDPEAVDSGYTYGQFLLHLSSLSTTPPTLKDMLDLYDYSFIRIPTSESPETPPLSEMLKELYGIPESDLDEQYRKFIKSHWKRIKATFRSTEEPWAKPKTEITQKTDIRLGAAEYAGRLRRFHVVLPEGYDRSYDLLIVQKKSIAENLQNLELVPLRERSNMGIKTKYGMFLESTGNDPDEFYMLELFGSSVGVTSKGYGEYSVYTLLPPQRVDADVKGDQLRYVLPDMDPAMRDGYMDGFRVTITPSNGLPPYVEHIKREGANALRTVNLTKIIPKELIAKAQKDASADEQITFKISVCEYINQPTEDGVYRIYGPESEEFSGARELLAKMGAQSGKMEISLCWYSKDDLDLHCITPEGVHIYFRNPDAGGGQLDVDMNVKDETAVSPAVEHIRFAAPGPGVYQFYIDNYTDRTDGETKAEVWVDIDSNPGDKKDPSKMRTVMKETVMMGSRSKTWSIDLSQFTNPETGEEYIDGSVTVYD